MRKKILKHKGLLFNPATSTASYAGKKVIFQRDRRDTMVLTLLLSARYEKLRTKTLIVSSTNNPVKRLLIKKLEKDSEVYKAEKRSLVQIIKFIKNKLGLPRDFIVNSRNHYFLK